MTRTIAGASLAAFLSVAALAQSAETAPSFEVASIKPAPPPADGHMMIAMGGDPGRVNYKNVSLKDVLTRAYEVRSYQVIGPSWIEGQRFDITAKVPDGAPKEQIPAMLQGLLAERFKLKIHRERKELPAYALVVGKNGPKLEKAEEDTTAGAGPAGPGPGPGGPGKGMIMFSNTGGTSRLEMKKITLGNMTDMLSKMLDRPVVDMTDLKGAYNISLDVSMEELAGMRGVMRRMTPAAIAAHGLDATKGEGMKVEGGPAPDGAPSQSIFTAMQKIGLKLEARKLPIDLIVVDSGEKVPTEN